MRKIIFKVQNNYILIKKRRGLTKYDLLKNHRNRFTSLLKKGFLIDFKYRVVFNGSVVRKQIIAINQIVNLNPVKIVYDINFDREIIMKDIMKSSNFAFIDFEMSMPPYNYKGNHFHEIIQYGITLKTNKRTTYYSGFLKKKNNIDLSDRTVEFLKINKDVYSRESINFKKLLKIMIKINKKPNLRWVVWGRSDIRVFQSALKLHKIKMKKKFIFLDLLKAHKIFFNLYNDLGLFKAYEFYSSQKLDQKHNALEDSKITSIVMEKFQNYFNFIDLN